MGGTHKTWAALHSPHPMHSFSIQFHFITIYEDLTGSIPPPSRRDRIIRTLFSCHFLIVGDIFKQECSYSAINYYLSALSSQLWLFLNPQIKRSFFSPSLFDNVDLNQTKRAPAYIMRVATLVKLQRLFLFPSNIVHKYTHKYVCQKNHLIINQITNKKIKVDVTAKFTSSSVFNVYDNVRSAATFIGALLSGDWSCKMPEITEA